MHNWVGGFLERTILVTQLESLKGSFKVNLHLGLYFHQLFLSHQDFQIPTHLTKSQNYPMLRVLLKIGIATWYVAKKLK